MEKKMETLYRDMLRLYWVYNGIMEKKMETTILGYIGVIIRLYWVYIGINGKEHGNYYSISGLYWDSMQECCQLTALYLGTAQAVKSP